MVDTELAEPERGVAKPAADMFTARDAAGANAEHLLRQLNECMLALSRLNQRAHNDWLAALEAAEDPLTVAAFRPFEWSAAIENHSPGLRTRLMHVTLGADGADYSGELHDIIGQRRAQKREQASEALEAAEKALLAGPDGQLLMRIIDKRVRERVPEQFQTRPRRPA